jgi:hypothetical protein
MVNNKNKIDGKVPGGTFEKIEFVTKKLTTFSLD